MRPDPRWLSARSHPSAYPTATVAKRPAPAVTCARTVANRLTGVNLADLQDFCVEPDNLAHRVGPARLRVDAVERRPRPDKIEMVVVAQKDPGRRRQARRHAAQTGSRRREPRVLVAVQRVIRLVGAGEMAQQPMPADHPGSAEIVGEPGELARRQAESGHPGVDMQHRRQRPAPRRDLPPLGDLAGVVQHRDQSGLGEFLRRTRHRAIQNGNFVLLGQGLAQGQRLVEGRDEKPPAPGRGQRTRNDRGAEPVAIGLDHRRATGRSDLPRQIAPVRDDPRDIDFEHSGSARSRTDAHLLTPHSRSADKRRCKTCRLAVIFSDCVIAFPCCRYKIMVRLSRPASPLARNPGRRVRSDKRLDRRDGAGAPFGINQQKGS